MGSSATILSSLAKVPPFPPVAARLLALLGSSSVEISEVAELISSDATLSARLLQCLNSYEFGLAYPVSNIQQAVALIGLPRTRDVTLTHAMAAYSKQALRAEELRRCWQHSIATAVLADQIAQACGAFTDVAFTAGIMHDIGRLGLVVAYPREYELIIRNAAERCVDLLEYEKEQFGVHHAEAGRMLAERWGLPLDLRIVAGRHHDHCEGVELDLLRIIHVACRLADVLGYYVSQPLIKLDVDAVLNELPAHARKRLHKTPEELCTAIEQRILEYDSDHTHTPPQQFSVPAELAIEDHPPLASSVDTSNEPRYSYGLLILAIAVPAIIAALVLWKVL